MICETNSLVNALGIRKGDLILEIAPRPATGDEEHAEKGKEAAAHEFDGLLAGGTLKVTVEDGAANDYTESKQNKLDRDDLGRIEALKSLVQVSDLHDGGREENE
jgi:hypothetical protein